MLQVHINISGDAQTINRLRKAGQSMYQLQTAMRQVGEALGNGDKGYFPGQVFASRGGVIGHSWQGLSPKYKAEKAKEYPGAGPLIRTGRMKRGFRYKADATSVTISNDTPYFKYHQSKLPRKKIPYRPMMGVNSPVKDIVKKIIELDINKNIRKQGF